MVKVDLKAEELLTQKKCVRMCLTFEKLSREGEKTKKITDSNNSSDQSSNVEKQVTENFRKNTDK